MEKIVPKVGDREVMPVMERDRMVKRESDGRMMPKTFAPVAIVHDAGQWFFYEAGDVIPDHHRPASEKEADKS